MKKRIILIGFAAILAIAANSQNSVVLDITHKLNGEDFDFNIENTTPENETFEVHRLEYYLSSFSVTHDGGTVTDFDSVWNLVQAGSGSSTIMLGDASIQDVESVSFSVGVDQAHNHLDPTQYPSSHPLGPKSPSMHWGWNAGYRFVAMEGEETDGGEQFEIHALGDQNYFETTIDVEVSEENGNVIIPIFANYAEALGGIELKDGVITHGDYAEAIDLLENFRDHVFTATEPIDSIPNDTTTGFALISQPNMISIAPNPSQNGTINVLLDQSNKVVDRVDVFDITGELVASKMVVQNTTFYQLNSLRSGIYLVKASGSDGEVFQIEKTIVLQ